MNNPQQKDTISPPDLSSHAARSGEVDRRLKSLEDMIHEMSENVATCMAKSNQLSKSQKAVE